MLITEHKFACFFLPITVEIKTFELVGEHVLCHVEKMY